MDKKSDSYYYQKLTNDEFRPFGVEVSRNIPGFMNINPGILSYLSSNERLLYLKRLKDVYDKMKGIK